VEETSRKKMLMIVAGAVGGIVIVALARSYLAASDEKKRCAEPSVVTTVRSLLERENGLVDEVTKAALTLGADITTDRIDRDTSSIWCSVSYQVDMKRLSNIWQQEFSKTKDPRAKDMVDIFNALSAVSNERRASYKVQPTPDGRFYITLNASGQRR
jgi:hypothetical protein